MVPADCDSDTDDDAIGINGLSEFCESVFVKIETVSLMYND